MGNAWQSRTGVHEARTGFYPIDSDDKRLQKH